jgi:hypothetical protein
VPSPRRTTKITPAITSFGCGCSFHSVCAKKFLAFHVNQTEGRCPKCSNDKVAFGTERPVGSALAASAAGAGAAAASSSSALSQSTPDPAERANQTQQPGSIETASKVKQAPKAHTTFLKKWLDNLEFFYNGPGGEKVCWIGCLDKNEEVIDGAKTPHLVKVVYCIVCELYGKLCTDHPLIALICIGDVHRFSEHALTRIRLSLFALPHR